MRAEGDLARTGRWALDQQGEVTAARYRWEVHTTRPWMNLLAPIARPVFTWNSKGVMLQAGGGLARYLGVPLVDSDFTAPAEPGMRRLCWAVLAAAILWLVGRRARSTRHR